jgi:hypothetical protein
MMWNWILIGSLYVLGMGVMTLLGGLGSAGEAMQRWGESSRATSRSAGRAGGYPIRVSRHASPDPLLCSSGLPSLEQSPRDL